MQAAGEADSSLLVHTELKLAKIAKTRHGEAFRLERIKLS